MIPLHFRESLHEHVCSLSPAAVYPSCFCFDSALHPVVNLLKPTERVVSFSAVWLVPAAPAGGRLASVEGMLTVDERVPAATAAAIAASLPVAEELRRADEGATVPVDEGGAIAAAVAAATAAASADDARPLVVAGVAAAAVATAGRWRPSAADLRRLDCFAFFFPAMF